MIDLSMMAKVLDALPPGAALILLGDRDQLDAVQPGSVFGDLCRSEGSGALQGQPLYVDKEPPLRCLQRDRVTREGGERRG